MKIIANALRFTTLEYLHRDLDSRMDREGLWTCANRLAWTEGLNDGFSGQVLSCPASLIIQGMIVNEMNRYVQLPRTTRWTAQYCRWGRDTGINPHSDERYLLGATLYLNETWQQEWGGLFMCKDTVVPQYNLLVINDRQENHCVSRIKPQAPYERITLQIWAQGR